MTELAADLVGRTAELEELDGVLAELGRSGCCALELTGEPGIGKTRLLAELGARADERRHIVLSGSAAELERELPFWVFVDALDEYVRGLEPRRLASLDDDARAELAHLLPSVGAGDGRAARTPADGRYRTHRAVRLLLEALAATKPVVLLLDDLHWADWGSVELLDALLRRPPRAPVLLALAARPRQLPERLASALERARRTGTIVRLELHALNVEETRQLLGAAVDDLALSRLYEASGGNPLYLQLLARSSDRPGAEGAGAAEVLSGGLDVPPAVAAALAGDLALLDAEVRRVLEGAAVAGDPFEPELAAAAAGLHETAAVEALDELLRRDLVRHTDVPRRFRFRHPLVRRTVYDAAPGGWRLAAHERTSRALAARGATALQLAHHVERSARHGDAGAVTLLRQAGDAAAPRAPGTAARLYAAALRLLGPAAPERADLLAAQAQALAAAGRFREGYAASLETIEALPEDAVALRVRVTAACAGLENLLGHHQEAHARLTAALDGLSDRASPEASSLMLELAVDRFYRMEYGPMRDWARRALSAARPLGDGPGTASASGVLALACAFAGDVAGAEAARAEAAALVDAMDDADLARCLDRAVDTLAAAEVYLDRHEEGGARVERSLAVARATGQGHVLPVLFWTGTIRTLRGRLSEAAELLDTAVEVGRVAGHAEGMAWNLFARSLAASLAGDVQTALATAEESVASLRPEDASFPALGAGLALAGALIEAGEAERAADTLLEAAGGEELELLPAVWRADGFELLTRCRLALGRRREANLAAARARVCSAALGLRMPAAVASRAAAAVALDAGDPALAAEAASASAAAADAVGAVLQAALSRVLAGRALAGTGATHRAVTELERAAAAFDACGALPRRDAAERELRRLGRPRHRHTRRGRRDGSGIETLTERELQVARLVVDRRTNAEIAADLFLSPKTVETHVRHLFQKLGVSSRVEVARAVERADRAARDAAAPQQRGGIGPT